MVSLSRLSDPQAVQSAIEEFHRLGREKFRKTYRGGKSRDYVAVVDGDVIDSKPLAASAYRHQTNITITCRDFSGGEQTRNALKPLLEQLGHSWMTVEEAHHLLATPSAEVSRTREILTIDEVLDRYNAIETEHEMIAESDDEILLLGLTTEGSSQLDFWRGWSKDRSTYTMPINGRENLDLILHEDTSGRPLRLFNQPTNVSPAERKLIDSGVFRLDAEQRFTEFDPEQGSTMYLLHLRPVGDLLKYEHFAAAPQPFETDINAEVVPLENHVLSQYDLPARDSQNVTKGEQEIVGAFAEFLLLRGHTLGRFKITTQGSICPLFSDLYDKTEATLYEAKSSTSRLHLRLGLGQILDYRRFLSEDVRTSLLLPGEPQRDMLELLDSHSVSTVWPGPSKTYFKFSDKRYAEYLPSRPGVGTGPCEPLGPGSEINPPARQGKRSSR